MVARRRSPAGSRATPYIEDDKRFPGAAEMGAMRKEADSIGAIDVPADRLWGA